MRTLFVLGLVATMTVALPTEDLVKSLANYTDISFGMYSGYVPVNDTQKEIHYIATLSMNDPANDPVIIWFSGGPGCSSTLAFAYEIGPYVIDNGVEFVKNDYPWNSEANVIYVDAPAGVPYSKCPNASECIFDDNTSADDNLKAVLNLMTMKFTDWQKNDLYLAGESYAGIYVPYLTKRLDEYITNNTGKADTYIPNFKGFMVGNGVTNWKYDGTPAYFHQAYHYGLIDQQLYDNVTNNCDISYYDLDYNSLSQQCQDLMNKFNDRVDGVNIYDMYGKCETPHDPASQFYHHSHSSVFHRELSYTPFLKSLKPKLKASPPCTDMTRLIEFFKLNSTRTSLNIPDDAPAFDPCTANQTGKWEYYNVREASYQIYVDLKTKYRMLHFSGDTDGAVGTWGTKSWFNDLPVNSTSKDWRAYFFNGQTAGYVVEKDNLTFATIHGAGHTAAQIKRPEVYHVVFSFIKGEEL